MLTFNDVNRDIKAILDGVSDNNRPVPSAVKTMRSALTLPAIGSLLSALTFGIVCANLNHRNLSVSLFIEYFFSGGAIPVYMSIVAGLFQYMLLLPYIGLYNLIPQDIRKKNPLIIHFKSALFKGSVLYICALVVTCLMSFYDPIYLLSTPILMIVAVFVTSITVNLKVTKYGVAPLLKKIKNNLS
ncbi:hypothetical protein H0Z85_003802, partial [Salmonella enterica]|nr:hypothetical protein [Salmonella enterica]EEI0496317.1 hypothetical protein [Salmonella enterica]EFR7426762.1 hypothetical protein [Salmonella enterica]EGB2753324.1 hypothetical protein [Salmonella enterica]EGJ6137478.1 hypothetical protein [Salmonella enterica]